MLIGSILASGLLLGQIAETPRILNTDATDKPQKKEAPVGRLYIPKGFDDNDISQIIITGRFTDDRHRVIGTKITKDAIRRRIYYTVESLEYSTPTGEESMDYIQVVDLGLLPRGNYQILPESKSDVEDIEKLGPIAGVLTVRHTDSPKRDDYIYAAVDSAVVRKDENGLRRWVQVFGTKNNSCLEFDGKMIDRYGLKKTDEGLIEILPIMKKEGQNCLTVNEPFEFTFIPPNDIPSDRYLLHIRTYEGQSFNKMVSIQSVISKKD